MTCGSLIKLAHDSSKALLHSHDIAYGTGSGQQSVTGFPDLGDANSLWLVRGPKARCSLGRKQQGRTAVRSDQGQSAGCILRARVCHSQWGPDTPAARGYAQVAAQPPLLVAAVRLSGGTQLVLGLLLAKGAGSNMNVLGR